MRGHGAAGYHISMADLLWNLPFFDNVYLSMQGQNVTLVDFYLRDLESALLAELIEKERTPTQSAMFVSALSQMWIFATYELLRTWRQWARELKQAVQKPDAVAMSGDGESARPNLSELHWQEDLHRLRTDKKYAAELDEAFTRVEPVFRRVEALRMNLAKHEVPKKSQRALAPGYGRIDQSDGSIQWQVDLGDNVVDLVSRRSLADHLRRVVTGRTLDEEPESDEGESNGEPKRLLD